MPSSATGIPATVEYGLVFTVSQPRAPVHSAAVVAGL